MIPEYTAFIANNDYVFFRGKWRIVKITKPDGTIENYYWEARDNRDFIVKFGNITLTKEQLKHRQHFWTVRFQYYKVKEDWLKKELEGERYFFQKNCTESLHPLYYNGKGLKWEFIRFIIHQEGEWNSWGHKKMDEKHSWRYRIEESIKTGKPIL